MWHCLHFGWLSTYQPRSNPTKRYDDLMCMLLIKQFCALVTTNRLSEHQSPLMSNNTILFGAPRLSLTKYFRNQFLRVSLT